MSNWAQDMTSFHICVGDDLVKDSTCQLQLFLYRYLINLCVTRSELCTMQFMYPAYVMTRMFCAPLSVLKSALHK